MITRFNREQLVKNLPDAYDKRPESNNAKLLEIDKRTNDALQEAISAIADSLNIEHATGTTLDLYGEMIGQPRGAATDEQYRTLIKNKIVRNFSNADHTSVVKAICATFGCDPADVLLTELAEPCRVKIEGLPISKLNESNIDIHTAVQIVAGLMPAGVFVEAMEFTGTFEFEGGTELVYDTDKGFGDEAQTIGGYLGLLSGQQGSNLPV